MTLNLTHHFSLDEMTASQTATRRGLDNEPSEGVIKALTLLCENVLEPVREHFGRPVRVSSGYRSPALNKAIGGSPTSQHVKGEAADITCPGVDNLRLARWIRDNLRFDQLIMEGGWVHVSFSASRARKSVLTAHFGSGKVRYTEGLA
jgi:zinc D-Ala-D-Ala carboxypeptidase